MQQLTKLSATSLNVFLDCPRCFWLMINKGIKRPRGPMPSITTGMDTVIKKYFDIFRHKKVLPPFLKGEISARLIEKLPQALYYKPSGKDALLWGKLDECVILEDGSYAALDHKTKGSSPKEVHSSFKFQMDVYTLLLQENGYKVKNVAFLVYYFPLEPWEEGEGFLFQTEVHSINTSPENARKVFFEALKVLEGPLPASNPECEFCKYIDAINNLDV